eukprot:Lankesteria_metandrocarpae@DN1999_c0_g1_i2.p1
MRGNNRINSDILHVLWPWLTVRSLYNLTLTCKDHWSWFLSEAQGAVLQQYFQQKVFEYIKRNDCYNFDYGVRMSKVQDGATGTATWQDHYSALRQHNVSKRKPYNMLFEDIIEFEHERWVRLKDMALCECCVQRCDIFLMYVRIDKATGKPKIQDADNAETTVVLNNILASCVSDRSNFIVKRICDTIELADILPTKSVYSYQAIKYEKLDRFAMKCFEFSMDPNSTVPSAEILYEKFIDMRSDIRDHFGYGELLSEFEDEGECISPANVLTLQKNFGPVNSDHLFLLYDQLLHESYIRGNAKTSSLSIFSPKLFVGKKSAFPSGSLSTIFGNITMEDIGNIERIWQIDCVCRISIAALKIPHFYPYNNGTMYRTETCLYRGGRGHGDSGGGYISSFIGPAAVLIYFKNSRV